MVMFKNARVRMSQGTKGIGYWHRFARGFANLYQSRSLVDRFFRGAVHLREQKVLELVRQHPGASVLDLGCGPGRQLVLSVQQGASKAVGLDAAPGMLALAKEARRKAFLTERVELIQGVYGAFKDPRRFDLVWALGVFDYAEDPDLLLRVMKEHSSGLVVATFRRIWVLRYPFRKLYYALQGCPVHFHSKGQIEALFRRNGVSIQRLEVLGGTLYFVVGGAS